MRGATERKRDAEIIDSVRQTLVESATVRFLPLPFLVFESAHPCRPRAARLSYDQSNPLGIAATEP
jgi:hypothetical protein